MTVKTDAELRLFAASDAAIIANKAVHTVADSADAAIIKAESAAAAAIDAIQAVTKIEYERVVAIANAQYAKAIYVAEHDRFLGRASEAEYNCAIAAAKARYALDSPTAHTEYNRILAAATTAVEALQAFLPQ